MYFLLMKLLQPNLFSALQTFRHLKEYFIENRWCLQVAMERNNAGGFYKVEVEEESDIPIIAPWTGKEVNDPFVGVPSMAAQWEMGRYVLPYGDAETRRIVDIVVGEFHGSEERSTAGRLGDIRGRPNEDDLNQVRRDTAALLGRIRDAS